MIRVTLLIHLQIRISDSKVIDYNKSILSLLTGKVLNK